MAEVVTTNRKKYTPERIQAIVASYKTGLTMREVAEKFGCSQSTVSRFIAENNYDRTHVGGTVARSIPAIPHVEEKPIDKQKPNPFRVMARTLKLHSDVTGHSYTVSTESDVVDIEADNALMQLSVKSIDAFIEELTQIKAMLGNPL